MIRVSAFIELPGEFGSDEAALAEIRDGYGLWDWQSIQDVAYVDGNGAWVDLPEQLASYYDPELATFLFRVETATEEPYEEEVLLDAEDPDSWTTVVRTRTVPGVQLRAASFLPRTGDADAEV